MMAVKTIEELIKGTEPIDLTGATLCAETNRDGYTGTYSGKYWFTVTTTTSGEPESEVTNYEVAPAIFDQETQAFKASDDPIIITEGNVLYRIVGTNRDSYTFPIVKEEIVEEHQVIEKQVLQAFLAFVADQYRFGVHHFYVIDSAEVVTP